MAGRDRGGRLDATSPRPPRAVGRAFLPVVAGQRAGLSVFHVQQPTVGQRQQTTPPDAEGVVDRAREGFGLAEDGAPHATRNVTS